MPAPIAPCLVIFDHDGVLVDSFDLHLESWLELGRRTGLPFTRTFLHDTFGMTNPSYGKPDPEVFLVAARKAEVAAGRSLVFEDAVVGIQAAKAAGMLAIGVGTTRPVEELGNAGADLAVRDLIDFPIDDWVERLRSR